MFQLNHPDIPNYSQQLMPLLKKVESKRCVNFTLGQDDPMIDQLSEMVDQLIKEKQKEAHHKKDDRFLKSRFINGFLGELAVEKMTGLNFHDHSIGNSSEYNLPDMEGCDDNCLTVGIKTFSYEEKLPHIGSDNFVSGKQTSRFPLINYQPQIDSAQLIVIRKNNLDYQQPSLLYPNGFYNFTLLGYVPQVDLLDPDNLYHRFVQHLPLFPRKTNFIGLDKVIPLHDYMDYSKMSLWQKDQFLSQQRKYSTTDFNNIQVLKQHINTVNLNHQPIDQDLTHKRGKKYEYQPGFDIHTPQNRTTEARNWPTARQETDAYSRHQEG